jgi:hypothetical protein
MIEKNHREITGMYNTPKVNQEIIFTEGRAIFDPKGLAICGEARILMKFFPFPRIIIEAVATQFIKKFEAGNKFDIEFPSIPLLTEVVVSSFTISNKIQITALPTKDLLIPNHKIKICKIVFHIFNFPQFLGWKGVFYKKNNKIYKKGLLLLKEQEWKIVINSVSNLKALTDDLKINGGYAITHVGIVEQKYKRSITIDEAKNILQALSWYFSFCRGFFVGSLLPVGFSRQNKPSFKRWHKGLLDSWQVVFSWFDHHHGQLIADVFPGFLKRWQDEIWRDSIETAIYWYIRSNTSEGGIDGSIILAQAALELLAWTLLVDDKKKVSYVEFNKMPAAKKITLLLSECSIPLEMPSTLSELNGLKKRFGWDGPKAFTEIRNFLVHPGDKRKRLAGKKLPLAEVWQLGLWYIELVLLYLFGHVGYYADRLRKDAWVGQVDLVPWGRNI